MQRAGPLPWMPQVRAVRCLAPARGLAAWAAPLRRCVARWGQDDDERYLVAAGNLEELERRQRRLERDGLRAPGAWLS
ncbi:hypothetical protein [Azohydromonas australica]|uniref:hypothetical protein n=1 Tax=Azohydromonas australica TaxID=364039 RepID=UPI0012EBBC14|nr:hypothetical protein [Azohydromonas australica]